MLNEDTFNDIGFNVTGNIKKLITLLVDTLFKKKNILKSFTSDLIISYGLIKSITCDLIIQDSDKVKSTTCDLILIYKYVEKINLKSYIKTVEDVHSNIPVGRIIISRKSELY